MGFFLGVVRVSCAFQGGESFEVAASVQIKNNRTGQSSCVSSFEFLEHHSIFSDEVCMLYNSCKTIFVDEAK